jgi:guanylate kinase
MKMTTLTSATPLHKVFCLIGPSGTGKSVLASKIPLPEVVSYRTRAIRTGEVDGVNGHFITKEEFLAKKDQNLWIAETEYSGEYYGITQGELVELEDSPMVYVIDWEGVEVFEKDISKIEGYSKDQIVRVFIHTPREDLETRMQRQGRDRAEIRARLDRADRDYANRGKCDYVIHNTNGELDTAAYQLMKIILEESF